MDRLGPHLPQRVARPDPADERGWLRLVLDHQPLPALVVDVETGKVIVQNEAAGRLLLAGAARAAVGGEAPAAPDQVLARLVADAAGEAGAAVTWHTPGGAAPYQVFARPLPPADGRAPFAVLTFLDTAGREAVERELRAALEARDEFFSVATHELKDPLFSIHLSVQLLAHMAERHGPVPAHVAQHLDVCGRQVDRLSRIIDNLLDVSRIRGGRLQLDPEAFDLGELAREVAHRFQEPARSAGSTLAVEAADQVIGYFDRLKLDQVLSNLLTNALKYGAGKPVVVRVRQEGEFAVLEVADGGPGVAPADRERIFARFERASEAHKKESLGLGLYIVRSFAEAHGGTAAVSGEPGRGATFTVTLPRNRLHHQEGAAGGRGQEPEGTA